MNVKSRTWLKPIIFGTALLSTAVLTYQIVLYRDPEILLFLVAGIAALIIAWRPAIGLAAYLIVYPMVPAEESLNLLKIARKDNACGVLANRGIPLDL